ncbi:MAG: hypothetical protein LBO80_03165 [Treponema sp.]|jgi:hypothetical protein|nr:hypothetical protein [Treponema sp.]
MDFLFDNGLFIVLAIIVFVIRLFLQFIAKDKKRKSPPPDSVPLQEADEEGGGSSYANTRGASDYFKRHMKESRTVPARRAAPVQTQAADFLPHWLEEPEERPKPVKKVPRKQQPPAAVSQTALPSAELSLETLKPAPQVKEALVSGFPENLAYLSSLKRAVAVAEILGTPKGLG